MTGATVVEAVVLARSSKCELLAVDVVIGTREALMGGATMIVEVVSVDEAFPEKLFCDGVLVVLAEETVVSFA